MKIKKKKTRLEHQDRRYVFVHDSRDLSSAQNQRVHHH